MSLKTGVALLACCLTTTVLAESKPNIVFFFIDDMGYGDIGSFGSTKNKTPHLDTMAAEGRVFTDFYVSSTACTPSRSALLTGCYAERVGMDGKVVFPGDERGLNPNEITIAEMLKEQGYATGCFGKWHLGDHPDFMPDKQGFDEYVGIPYSNDMWPGFDWPPLPFIKNHKTVAHISTIKDQAVLGDALSDAVIDFITRHKDQPFFAYFPHSMVHGPRYVTKERSDRSGGDSTTVQIEEVDESVGRVMKTLNDLGIAEKTLVFFTSDNGGAPGTSMGPLRGGKGGPKYEGHMRVPTVAWWPGKIPAGTKTSEIGRTIDIFPTLAKLTGGKIPTDRVIDGKDYSDVLLGKPEAESPTEVLFYEFEGVRRGNWKLVQGRRKLELFNLEEDLSETNDLAKTYPKILADLKAKLAAHQKKVESNKRPAAFVDHCDPIDTEGLPHLADFLGRGDVEMPLSRTAKKQKNKK